MSRSSANDLSHRHHPSSWQLQEAKARFSEVVRRAVEQGPQHVTVNGEERAVVMSAQDDQRLTSQRAELHHWLEQRLRPLFEWRALPVMEDILLQWRLMIEAGRKRGHPFSHPDVLIAATAAQHGLTVVTWNINEFVAAGIPTFNPWKDPF